MQKNTKLFGVISVLASFAALVFLQSAGSLISAEIASPLTSAVVYFVAVFGAAFLLKALTRVLFRPICEEESAASAFAEKEETKPRERGEIIAFVALTAVLVAMGVTLTLRSAGDPSQSLIFAAVVGVLLKAPLEEYLFRYLFVNALLRSGAGLWLSIGLQAVLFALWHSAGMRIFALAAGICFGIIVSISGRGGSVSKRALILSVLSHAIYNAAIYGVAFTK